MPRNGAQAALRLMLRCCMGCQPGSGAGSEYKPVQMQCAPCCPWRAWCTISFPGLCCAACAHVCCNGLRSSLQRAFCQYRLQVSKDGEQLESGDALLCDVVRVLWQIPAHRASDPTRSFAADQALQAAQACARGGSSAPASANDAAASSAVAWQWPVLDSAFWLKVAQMLGVGGGLHVADDPEFVQWLVRVIQCNP